jgi:hypothetical protein
MIILWGSFVAERFGESFFPVYKNGQTILLNNIRNVFLQGFIVSKALTF